MFNLDTILDWSFRLLMMGLFILWWHRCHKYGWTKINALVTSILACFGAAIGEGYYLKTGKLPWFFGAEETFAGRDDGAAAFFLVLLGIITYVAVVWLLPKFANWWNSAKYAPGSITKVSISGIGLVILLFVCGNASANLCRSYGYTWGIQVVSLGGNICAEASEIGLTENDRMQEDFDEMGSRAQRRAPIKEHRNTRNGKKNGN